MGVSVACYAAFAAAQFNLLQVLFILQKCIAGTVAGGALAGVLCVLGQID